MIVQTPPLVLLPSGTVPSVARCFRLRDESPRQYAQPAQYHEASLTKAVAVLPFAGPEGRAFAAEMESVLAGIGIDDKPYFTLVDRASIDKVVSEMKFSQSGLVDEKTAVKLGKLVGAHGIYTGVGTRNTYDDSPYSERRQTCTYYEQKRDKKGNLYRGACLQWR
jgi:hypothetical protein